MKRDDEEYYERGERRSHRVSGRRSQDSRSSHSQRRRASEEASDVYERHAARAAERKKKNNRRRNHLIAMIFGELVLLAAAVAMVFVISKYNKIQTVSPSSWGNVTIEYNTEIEESVITAMETGYTDIMIFGVDSRLSTDTDSLDEGTQGDVTILAHVNNATGEVTLVSFYRDLYLNYDGRYRKLTDIYAAYGATGALGAINRNLDLNVQQFVTVSWASAAEVIDQLGGVYIDLPEEMMYSINGYITETVNETGIGTFPILTSGYQHLDGVQTVAYCRIRKATVPGYDFGDYGRTERQREVLQQLLAQAKTLTLAQMNDILDMVLPEVYTNLTLTDCLSLGSKIFNFYAGKSIGYPYDKDSPDENVVIAIDTEANIIQLHQDLYGTEDGYSISSTAQEIADWIYEQYGE